MLTDTIRTASSCADDSEPGVLGVHQARERILAALPPLQGEERVALRAGLGRVLAREVISPLDVPGHDNSAIDGYAWMALNCRNRDSSTSK